MSRRPREEPAAGAGFRAPLRWDDDVCRVVDQRRLPDVLVDIEVRGAADGVAAIRDEAIVGSAAQAQLGGRDARARRGQDARRTGRSPAARRSAAPPTRSGTTRPGSAAVARNGGSGCSRSRTGWGSTPTARRSPRRCAPRPSAILQEATDAHGALVGHALGGARRRSTSTATAPLRVLTIGSTGAMGGGQCGTALSAIIAAHHAERPIEALVAETRPGLRRVADRRLGAARGRRDRTPWSPTPRRRAGSPRAMSTSVLVARRPGGGERRRRRGRRDLSAGARGLGGRGAVPRVRRRRSRSTRRSAMARRAELEEGRPAAVLAAAGTRVTPEGTASPQPGPGPDAGGAGHRDRHRAWRAAAAVRVRRSPAASSAAVDAVAGDARGRRGRRLMATIAVGQRNAVVARSTTDRAVLRAFLEQDRLFAAYAICDLEDREFGRTRWGIATAGDEVVAVGLEYSGLTPQPLFLMGRNDGIEAVLQNVVRPRAAYLAAKAESLPAVARLYNIDPGPADDPDVGRSNPVPARARPRSSACCPSRSASSTGCTSWASARGCRRARSPRASTTASGSTGSSSSAAGTHVDLAQRAPRGRRQRADPRRSPRPGLRAGRHVGGDRGAAPLLRPGRAQRPVRQPAGDRRPTCASATPSTAGSRSGSSAAPRRRGPTSPRPLRRLFSRGRRAGRATTRAPTAPPSSTRAGPPTTTRPIPSISDRVPIDPSTVMPSPDGPPEEPR